MNRKKYTPRLISRGLLLPFAFLVCLPGCAYYNSYYNASRLYNSASKDHRSFPDTIAASPSARENLKKAIDKYAQVAVKYPNSRWVLPSLYHMGGSYYLIGEFDKAERKYQEILQYYSESRYATASRLNLALIFYRLRQWDRSLWELSRLNEGDDRTMQQAAFLEALIYQTMSDHAKASISWERFLYRYYRSRLATQARYHYVVTLISLGEYSNASRELELLLGSRLKKDFRYNVQMLLAQCYRESGDQEKAIAIYRRLLKGRPDESKIPRLKLEMARALSATLTPQEISSQYRELAVKYPKTEFSAEALYQLAQLFESQQLPDSALEYYHRVSGENPSSFVREAALKRSADLSLLLAYRQQSDQQAAEQSAKLQFLMAEHYLFALGQPDSALASYLRVAENYSDQALAPKAWYAAAWTSLEYLNRRSQADSLFRLLVARYPRTRYANGARGYLGLPLDTTIVDVEPEIEFNLKPAPNKPDEPAKTDRKAPDDRRVSPPSEVSSDPIIPAPDPQRSTK